MTKQKSWKDVACGLFAAILGCDWSYQRVQTEDVHRELDKAMDDFKAKAKKRRKARS